GQSGAAPPYPAVVLAVAVQTDGKILIGGLFTQVNGVGRPNVARLNSDGTLDTGFLDGESGADQPVRVLAVQSNNKVVLAGSFTQVNGVARNKIARLNIDGTLDTGFLNGLDGLGSADGASVPAVALTGSSSSSGQCITTTPTVTVTLTATPTSTPTPSTTPSE